MSYRDLFVSPPLTFAGTQRTFEEAKYVILGASLDTTSTYRSGARFAPRAIREASHNIETYSFRSEKDVEDLKIHDLGDLHIAGEVDETLNRLKLVTEDILSAQKMPVILGGEHTITLGAVRSAGEFTLVSFDAHLDLRNDYMDTITSHTTFMRRINEQVKPHKILEIGTRAVCKEELEYAKKSRIKFLTVQQIRKDGIKEAVRKIQGILSDCEKIYLTIDMDVLDPAFAPAVQNPEADGLDMHMFMELLCRICCPQVVAFDLVEVAPHYDRGTTAIQAAKTIFEVMCHVEETVELG